MLLKFLVECAFKKKEAKCNWNIDFKNISKGVDEVAPIRESLTILEKIKAASFGENKDVSYLGILGMLDTT